jgi:hypothetical protein
LLAIKTLAGSGDADVLTREAAANDVDTADPVSGKSSCGERSDIVVTRDIRPPFSEHTTAEPIALAKRDGLQARALQAD